MSSRNKIFVDMYKDDVRHMDSEQKYTQPAELNSGEIMKQPNYLANSTDNIIKGRYYNKIVKKNQDYLARNSSPWQVGKFKIPHEVKYDRANVDNLSAFTMHSWGLEGTRDNSRKLQKVCESKGQHDFDFNIYNRRPNMDNVISDLRYTVKDVRITNKSADAYGMTESRKMINGIL